MAGNSIGKALVLTTFGESHGAAIGGVLDGFPSCIPIDVPFIQSELDRRNPASHPFSTARREPDAIEILSGLFNGMTTGAPIAFLIRNTNQRSEDYNHLEKLYRPSHADFTYEKKFGIRDHRGGGRASARTTAALVAGGAFSKTFLKGKGIIVTAAVTRVGPIGWTGEEMSEEIAGYLEKIRIAGDTAGGIITCRTRGVPPGLGEPVFDKLHADLAKAVLSIPSAKGFEIGSGFSGAAMKGSEHNDPFVNTPDGIRTATNHSGGIQGGISNGMEILFSAAFKPAPTLGTAQQTVDTSGKTVTFEGRGRHDVCTVFRTVVIVEAAAALVIADHLLRCH